MSQVLNIRLLPGFSERQPIIPPGAVYIGRANRRYRLRASKWANPFAIKREADREAAIDAYERWLRLQPHLRGALHELMDATLSVGAHRSPATAMCCCDWPRLRDWIRNLAPSRTPLRLIAIARPCSHSTRRAA